ncbi:MAG: arsenite methyltransferase [Gemmatimonadales bacterium]
MGTSELTTIVRERYSEAARQAAAGSKASCCGTGTSCGADPITTNLYSGAESAAVPSLAMAASLGCGNPTALAELRPGETVLDLGSGGGIDVLLSARRVGSTGKAYGLDMTDAMLEIARENQARADVTNVEFLKGVIEAIPLPDESVDVIISNCVINLSGEKSKVLAEAWRVLRPGGRFAVSDVLTRGAIPAAVRESMALWTGCVAGALDQDVFLQMLTDVGFVDASIEPTREYCGSDAAQILEDAGLAGTIDPANIDGHVFSGFIRARKPEVA